MFPQGTASGYMSGLSPDGRLDGAARYTEDTHQRSFVSASDRPITVIQQLINPVYRAISLETIKSLKRRFLMDALGLLLSIATEGQTRLKEHHLHQIRVSVRSA